MIPRLVLGTLSLAVLAALSWAVLALPAQPPGLTAEALGKLPESGVMNPVTAVLLNYRGHDTLLEVAVLLLAITGVWSLRQGEFPATDLRERLSRGESVRYLVPDAVAAYIHKYRLYQSVEPHSQARGGSR